MDNIKKNEFFSFKISNMQKKKKRLYFIFSTQRELLGSDTDITIKIRNTLQLLDKGI